MHGSKITLRSVYVVIKAQSKEGIKEIIAQNWVRLDPHQFIVTTLKTCPILPLV